MPTVTGHYGVPISHVRQLLAKLPPPGQKPKYCDDSTRPQRIGLGGSGRLNSTLPLHEPATPPVPRGPLENGGGTSGTRMPSHSGGEKSGGPHGPTLINKTAVD